MRRTSIKESQSKEAYVQSILKSIKYEGKCTVTSNDPSAARREKALDNAILYLCSRRVPIKGTYPGAVYIDYSCRVMGLAMHNVADVYSHKTVLIKGSCNYSDTKRGPNTFCKLDYPVDELWNKVVNNTKKGDKPGYIEFGSIGTYSDNPNFFPKRFTVGATNAMECLLIFYQYKPFEKLTFTEAEFIYQSPTDVIEKYPELKLHGLSLWIKDVYGKNDGFAEYSNNYNYKIRL